MGKLALRDWEAYYTNNKLIFRVPNNSFVRRYNFKIVITSGDSTPIFTLILKCIVALWYSVFQILCEKLLQKQFRMLDCNILFKRGGS